MSRGRGIQSSRFRCDNNGETSVVWKELGAYSAKRADESVNRDEPGRSATANKEERSRPQRQKRHGDSQLEPGGRVRVQDLLEGNSIRRGRAGSTMASFSRSPCAGACCQCDVSGRSVAINKEDISAAATEESLKISTWFERVVRIVNLPQRDSEANLGENEPQSQRQVFESFSHGAVCSRGSVHAAWQQDTPGVGNVSRQLWSAPMAFENRRCVRAMHDEG
jgi:hypothetical protein